MDRIFLHHSMLHTTAHLLCFSATESKIMEKRERAGRKETCSSAGRVKKSTYSNSVTIATKSCQQMNGLTSAPSAMLLCHSERTPMQKLYDFQANFERCVQDDIANQ